MRYFIRYLILSFFLINGTAQCQTLLGIENLGQTFRFISIDCSNDSITKYSFLPINYYNSYFSSCYDANNNIYYLCAGWGGVTIDASNGVVIDVDTLTPSTAEYITHIAFNSRDGLIYGVKINQVTLGQNFTSFNPVTDVLDTSIIINPVINFGDSCKGLIDIWNQKYILQSRDLSAIDLSTGAVSYIHPLLNLTGEKFDHAAYKCNPESVLGLSNNPVTQEEYLSIADVVTGNITHISSSSLPVSFYKQNLSGSSIDNNSGVFYYPALHGKIYGIDTYSGNLSYSHDFGLLSEILFLESASAYHCLIQNENSIVLQKEISVFPNPAHTNLFITQGDGLSISEIKIFNSIGQKQEINNPSISHDDLPEVNISNLVSGLYLVEILTGGERVVKRFVKE